MSRHAEVAPTTVTRRRRPESDPPRSSRHPAKTAQPPARTPHPGWPRQRLLGHGRYGLADASRGYFGLAPGELSWAQASLMAGVVQAPTAYDPLAHLNLAKQRQRYVLDRLVETGVFSQVQPDAAFAVPLRLTVPQA